MVDRAEEQNVQRIGRERRFSCDFERHGSCTNQGGNEASVKGKAPMRMWKRSLLTGSLLTIGLLAGCIGRVRQPEVTLTGVRLSGLGLRGGSLLAELEIKNPNGFDVETRSISYDLQVSDRNASNQATWIQFAKGTLDDRIKVSDH